MVELAEQARRKGILSFEGGIAGEDDAFLRTALSHMLDGVDWRSIQEALQIMILAENYKGAELLKKLIIAMGARSILLGDNPRIAQCFCSLCSVRSI